MALRKNIAATILSCAFTFSFSPPAGCTPPKAPCDEKIDAPKTYENMVLNSPVIQRLNSQLRSTEVRVSPCFVNERVMVAVYYELPNTLSEYELAYSDWILIDCSRDGRITLSPGTIQPVAFEADSILVFFKHKIRKVEENLRVKEFVAKTTPSPKNPIISLRETGVLIRRSGNHIEYNQSTGLVRGYLLCNDIDWQQFPEIKQAHRAIEEHLLVGALSQCAIGHGKGHSYTSADFHDSATGPWYLTVCLICHDGLKDAFIQINSDGSHEKPRVKFEY